MKKLRTNLPRRKRLNFSPVIIPSVAVKLDSTSFIDSASNLTRDVAFSCDSSSMSTNNRSLKKRGFGDGNVAAGEHNYNEPSNRIIKLLRPEDEEHEESYQMMKRRERRQVYLHDYAEEYCGMKEYGDLVVQQRLQMVHWIMEQSTNKDLQKETMFLGVSLLDRFLSKGYFKSQMELEIAGIACLTLATRLEENQPYNSIQQKLFNVGSNEYRRSEVVAMEWLVQEVLNFQCYLPTIYNFLWFYLKAARSDEDVDKTAKYLAVLALLGHEQLCYWPSTVAASLVSLACLAENKQSSLQQIAWIHNGSDDKDLPDCIKSLEWLVQYIC
ncbi:hypothetical protein L1987_87088 [Smallanthus sonchifolius]|nr:hypothetical protein L1987_87088 [Smallanthus sonchifolius]